MDIDAWNPNIQSTSAMRSGVKREFITPAIVVIALNINPELLLFDLNSFRFIMEHVYTWFECL